MNNQATATKADEQEVVCNHKPGDVWEDGCCTSQKNQKATTSESASSNALSPSEVVEQLTEAGKGKSQ